MPELTSKLKYKYYEKGEFTDKKARSLEDTLQLIRDFPWDSQGGVDVTLTCPSVTIIDESNNYLKVGTYFSGKLCLYYFTWDHHLYELPVASITEAEPFVTAFFNGEVDLEKFERNRLVANAVSNFEDGSFYYEVSAPSYYWRFIFLIVMMLLMLFSSSMVFFLPSPWLARLFFGGIFLFMIVFLSRQQYLVNKYFKRCQYMELELSSGRDIFSFGDTDGLLKYHKSELLEINIYGALAGKSVPLLTLFELVFKDETRITIPSMLLDPIVFINKFPNIKINKFQQQKEYKKLQWDYAMGK